MSPPDPTPTTPTATDVIPPSEELWERVAVLPAPRKFFLAITIAEALVEASKRTEAP